MNKRTYSSAQGTHAWDTQALDSMLLQLFGHWEHREWFWRDDSSNKSMDALFKSALTRTTQTLRAEHWDEPLLSWLDVQQPRTLLASTLVIGGAVSDAQQIQQQGLLPALILHWAPQTIGQAFSWMRSSIENESWERCVSQAKTQGIVLKQEPFSLFEHLSPELRRTLELHQHLGLRPTRFSLEQSLQNRQAPELFSMDSVF